MSSTNAISTTPTAPPGSLPSLRATDPSILSKSAYPEDFYPGGAYAALTHGETHYFLFGPEDGKKVVLVHGLSTPASVYSKVARHLSTQGCQVLLYDLYSRGYSTSPPEKHDHALYISQLEDLLQHIGWRQCNVVGLSVGGGIVACFAQAHPEMVLSLTFVAPAGLLNSSEIPLVGRLFQLPYSVELFSYQGFRSFFSRKNIESMRAEFAEEGKVPECIDQAGEILALQFQHHPGYARGVMSTLKHFPFTALAPTYGALQEEKFPVQVIWGTRDTVVPGTSVDAVERVLPRIKVTKIEGATHSIVMTHPEAIVQRLGGFVV